MAKMEGQKCCQNRHKKPSFHKMALPSGACSMEPLRGGGVVEFHKHLCSFVDIPIKCGYMPLSITGKPPLLPLQDMMTAQT